MGCCGTPTVRATCPRVGRLSTLRTRALRLDRDQRRAVVRSYTEAALGRPSVDD